LGWASVANRRSCSPRAQPGPRATSANAPRGCVWMLALDSRIGIGIRYQQMPLFGWRPTLELEFVFNAEPAFARLRPSPAIRSHPPRYCKAFASARLLHLVLESLALSSSSRCGRRRRSPSLSIRRWAALAPHSLSFVVAGTSPPPLLVPCGGGRRSGELRPGGNRCG
jgi:hypothetical protein